MSDSENKPNYVKLSMMLNIAMEALDHKHSEEFIGRCRECEALKKIEEIKTSL